MNQTTNYNINLIGAAKISHALMVAYAAAAVNDVAAARRDGDIVPTVFSTIVEFEAVNPEDLRAMRRVYLSDQMPAEEQTLADRVDQVASFVRYGILRMALDSNITKVEAS